VRDLLLQIEAWQAAGERVAVATVVRVVGSAPRPVGARLVVSSAGHMAGSVSGGCVETAVVQEMMDVLAGRPPRLLHFGITQDMIWDVGLACGGAIDVSVQLLDPALVTVFHDLLERKEPFALVTPVAGQGCAGDMALVTREGVAWGTADPSSIGPARQMLEMRAGTNALQMIEPESEVFVEPFLPPPVLLLIGGVHVAIPLSCFAKTLGFRVIVVDPRSKFANRERFPDADEVWVEWPDEALAHLAVDEFTYVVLLTHDPKIDEPALAAVLRTKAAYIGAIGSRRTHAARFERMARWGITAGEIGRVYAPIGLDLGDGTPEETALSIIAEVVAVKNGRQAGSLRSTERRIGAEEGAGS
jgi:xanthine dehydrogenase accessory factor